MAQLRVLIFQEVRLGSASSTPFFTRLAPLLFLPNNKHEPFTNMATSNFNTMGAADEAMREPLNEQMENEQESLEEEKENKINAIYPFFDLPQEVRDNIYDECLEDIDLPDLCLELHLKANKVPITALLLVNKAFSNEYRLRANTKQSLTVTDDCPRGLLTTYCQGNFDIPTRALTISTVYIEAFVLHLTDIEEHHDWISQLIAQLPAVRKVHLRVIIGREFVIDDFGDFENDTDCEESLTSVPYLASYKCYMRSKNWQSFEDCRTVVLQWDSGTGDVDVVLGPKEFDEELEEASNFPFSEPGEDSDEDMYM